MSSPGTILVVVRTAHALGALMPVIAALQQNGHAGWVLVTDPRPSATALETMRRSVPWPVERFAAEAPKAWRTPLRIAGRISPRLGRGLNAARMVRRSRRIVERIDPAAVLFTDDHIQPEAGLVRAAARRGKRTVLIQWAFTLPHHHYDAMRGRKSERPGARSLGKASLAGVLEGALARCRRWLDLPGRLRPCFGGGEADRIAVSGPAFVKQFADQGVSPDKMRITGNPQHDAVYRRKQVLAFSPNPSPAFRDKERERPGPLFVFGTQPLSRFGILPPHESRRQVRAVARSVLEIAGSRLQVSLHPREAPSDYDFLAEYGPRITVSQQADPTNLLAACDVYISQFSSTILVAMMLEKPVVLLHLSDLAGTAFFAATGGALTVRREEALTETLRKAMENGETRMRLRREQQRVLHDYARFDGRAVERIVALVEEGPSDPYRGDPRGMTLSSRGRTAEKIGRVARHAQRTAARKAENRHGVYP